MLAGCIAAAAGVMLVGSLWHSPNRPDSDPPRSRSKRVCPFMWRAILDTRVLIAEDLGAASTPLVLARVECYTRRSAASRHPSRWRGAATDM